MKPNTQKINRKDVITVPCSFCKKSLLRIRSYYKKHNNISFCSEMCKVYYKDPKQFNILNNINNPNFYYLLGLLATDGHMSYPNATKTSKTYYAMIRLIESDNELLYRLKEVFGGNVYNEKTNGFYSCTTTCWRVSNKEFIQYLIDIGFTNNKTYNLNIENWFNTLKDEYKKSFIRGCWDGDGSLNIHDRSTGNTKSITNHFCSASKSFFDTLVSFFKPTNGKIYERTKEQNKQATCSLYYFNLSGSNYIELSKIYDNLDINDLVMKRKLEKWNEIKNYFNNIHKDRIYTSNYYGVRCGYKSEWSCIIKNNYNDYIWNKCISDKHAAIMYDIATLIFNKKLHRINFIENVEQYKKLIQEHNLSTKNIVDLLPIVSKSLN